MSVVVSDSSPLICLSFLGRADLLHALFGTVYVPPAVAAEVASPRRAFTGVAVEQVPGVQVMPPSNPSAIAQAHPMLHIGEIEAMALAIELRADLLLVDEAAGRAAAEALGVATVGTLGVMLRAKQSGFIPEVRPLIDRLRNDLNFFVSDDLYNDVVQRAGE